MAKILLVDDDKDLVAAYRMMLTANGHEVTCAYSAGEARSVAAEADRFDLVLLDVMMESLTAGFDLARELHERWPRLPIVMVSAIQDATKVPFGFEPDEDYLPVFQFVQKPTDPQVVVDRVEQVLGTARPA
jgi:DNA-binding response OmpR family regulator